MHRIHLFVTCSAVAAFVLASAASPRATVRPQAVQAQASRAQTGPLPTIATKTEGLQKLDGFFPLYWDASDGTLYMEIPALDTEVLYQTGLGAGMGSNDIGLDRGLLVDTRVVSFEQVGRKVLMVQPNLDYRAITTNADERHDVEDAFAKSVIWGFTAVAETGGRVLVDLTDFLMRDATGLAGRLRPASYHFDKSRSAVYMPNTKAFPKNTEIEVTSTMATENPSGQGPGETGGRIGDVVPSPDSITLRQHHSFIELPDANYKPRVWDPRSGYFATGFEDYAAPLGKDMAVRYIERHRLTKQDPNAAMSDPVEPITYYVDRGTPEPIRSALVEGASWWNQAFEAAGFRNAFRVQVMPEGADPMDVRFNVINWVHRSTRGWSYGAAIADPRTGEILQGHVSLGSLRARQDYLIFEGLLSPYQTGLEQPGEITATVLARIRQLAAHETGHTIGLAHNYYDSTAGRISVMDYPHPLVTLKADGSMDLSNAYAVGIGEWDKVAVRYGYGVYPAATEAADLTRVLDDAWGRDLRFLSNQDTDLNPKVDQWVNGTDVGAELNRIMSVRHAALARFGETAIKRNEPMADIGDALVPVYLYQRYAVEAAASAVGGQNYFYALRGDGHSPVVQWAPAATQNAALDALLATLKPSELTLSPALLASIPPRPSGYGASREVFRGATGLAFDPITPASVAADVTVGFLLTSQRAARLVAQHAVDPSLPGLDQVLDRLVSGVFDAATASPYEAEVNRAVERVVVSRLIDLADTASMAQVRAIATARLKAIQARAARPSADEDAGAALQLMSADIQRFLDRPAEPARRVAPPGTPPGAPIGESPLEYLLGPLDDSGGIR
jgi:Met-zincin/Domain of unknown function (DUF5117)